MIYVLEGHAQMTSAVRGKGLTKNMTKGKVVSEADLVLAKWDGGHKLPKFTHSLVYKGWLMRDDTSP